MFGACCCVLLGLLISHHTVVSEETHQNSPSQVLLDEVTTEGHLWRTELCMISGCRCDTDDFYEVTKVTCNGRFQKKSPGSQTTAIALDERIRYPPKLEIIRISHFTLVDFGSSLRSELFRKNLSVVHVESAESLSLFPAFFKRVANFILKDIAMFTFDKRIDLQAFDALDADNILFKNVTFYYEDENYIDVFGPSLIRRRLEFDSCRISSKMPILIYQENVDDLTVVFRYCRIDGMASVIRGDRIEMIGNQFNWDCPELHDMSSADDCAEKTIELKYQTLSMASNTFQNKRVPDVFHNGSDGIVVDFVPGWTDLQVGEIWINLFDLKPASEDEQRQGITSCQEHPVEKSNQPRYRAACPNQEKIIEYLQHKNRNSNVNKANITSARNSSALLLSFCFSIFANLNQLVRCLENVDENFAPP